MSISEAELHRIELKPSFEITKFNPARAQDPRLHLYGLDIQISVTQKLFFSTSKQRDSYIWRNIKHDYWLNKMTSTTLWLSWAGALKPLGISNSCISNNSFIDCQDGKEWKKEQFCPGQKKERENEDAILIFPFFSHWVCSCIMNQYYWSWFTLKQK